MCLKVQVFVSYVRTSQPLIHGMSSTPTSDISTCDLISTQVGELENINFAHKLLYRKIKFLHKLLYNYIQLHHHVAGLISS
jgi:hypothetical protein